MWRRLTASALFGLGLLAVAVAATGQPPPGAGDKKPADKKAADPVEALIDAALANDPDVRVARAKVLLADAELAKARQGVVHKVITLKSAIEEQRRAVASAEEALRLRTDLYQRKAIPLDELIPYRDRLETARANLARLEAELKLMTGAGPAAAAAGWDDLDAVHRGATWNQSCLACHAVPAGVSLKVRVNLAEPVKGPMAERIRAALDKPVRLGADGEKVSLEKALAVFKKDAGLDVPVQHHARVGDITANGEALPVGAWFQMFLDVNPEHLILVREYGLLVTAKDLNPPDAVSVVDFWKQARAAGGKDEKPDKK